MKKALVLGAIAPFCDLVKEMEALNIAPIICDYYADAPAKKLGYPSFDISTTDYEAVLKIAQEYQVDGIVSAFSDRNLSVAYQLAEDLKLHQLYNMSIIDLLTDKLAMKDFFGAIGLPVIKYRILNKVFTENELKDISFPVVTKPIDAYGSKGIFVCKDQEEIRKVFDMTTKESLKYKDQIIVEEYYPVDEISITAWVKDGKPYITCIYDVIKNFHPTIILSAVSFPSKYTEEYYNQFSILLNEIVNACNIKEGPITLQCFIGKAGIKISELLFRLAGGSPYLYPTYFGGPNIAQMLLQYYVDEEISYQNLESFVPVCRDGVYFDIQIFVKEKGKIYYDFNVDDIKKELHECIDLRVYHKSGDELINNADSGRIFARAICKLNQRDNQAYYQLIEKIENYVQVFNEKKECISFIRKPEKLEIDKHQEIDWSFIHKSWESI